MKKAKLVITLILVLILLLASVPVSAEGDLSWLHPGEFPIVTKGVTKTLSIYNLQMDQRTVDTSKTWNYRFITEIMNIQLEETLFTNTNRNELISLAFAGNELPDVIYGAGFSTTELMRYGVLEGQILDWAPYINETYMPNLSKVYAQYPKLKSAISDSEGHIWSLGFIRDATDPQFIDKYYINYGWLQAHNLEIPTTLDELYDVLKAFKAENPDSYPLGGSYSSDSPAKLILNALGYITGSGASNGKSIMLRNGKTVMPASDREAFGEYLRFMNKLYTEELIHPDFFTMDEATTDAMLKEGKNLITLKDVSNILPAEEVVANWVPCLPLTSSMHETPVWGGMDTLCTLGSVVMTSTCKYPELVAAWMDVYFDYHGYQLMNKGPVPGLDPDEWLFEYPDSMFRHWNEETEAYVNGSHPDFPGNANYMNNCIRYLRNGILGSFLSEGHPTEASVTIYLTKYKDLTREEKQQVDFFHSNPFQYLVSLTQNMLFPYCTSELFPNFVFFDSETADELGFVKTSIDQYIDQETAKFIIGKRPLDELDAYFNQLDELGAVDYVKTYSDYYENWKSK